MRTVRAALLFVISQSVAGVAHASTDIGGELTIATDYMYRGVSQTMSDPALQVELAIENDTGWYGYLWASNVDFVPAAGPDDGAELEVNVAVGFSHGLSDSLSASLEGVAYVFPGTKPGYDYDYAEWLLGLQLHGRHRLTVGYSNSVFGSSDIGRFYAAATTLDLTSRARLDVELGYYDLQDALNFSYGYAEASIVYDANRFEWRLSYLTSDDDARTGFDPSTVRDRLVFAVSMSF